MKVLIAYLALGTRLTITENVFSKSSIVIEMCKDLCSSYGSCLQTFFDTQNLLCQVSNLTDEHPADQRRVVFRRIVSRAMMECDCSEPILEPFKMYMQMHPKASSTRELCLSVGATSRTTCSWKRIDKPTDNHTDKPTDKSTDKPIDILTEKPDRISYIPNKLSTDKLSDKSTDRATGTSTKKRNKGAKKKQTKKPNNLSDKLYKKPTAKLTNKRHKEPTAKLNEQFDKRIDTPTEKPTAKPTNKLSKAPTDTISKESIDKQTDISTYKRSEKPTDKPTEQITYKSSDIRTKKPTNEHTTKPKRNKIPTCKTKKVPYILVPYFRFNVHQHQPLQRALRYEQPCLRPIILGRRIALCKSHLISRDNEAFYLFCGHRSRPTSLYRGVFNGLKFDTHISLIISGVKMELCRSVQVRGTSIFMLMERRSEFFFEKYVLPTDSIAFHKDVFHNMKKQSPLGNTFVAENGNLYHLSSDYKFVIRGYDGKKRQSLDCSALTQFSQAVLYLQGKVPTVLVYEDNHVTGYEYKGSKMKLTKKSSRRCLDSMCLSFGNKNMMKEMWGVFIKENGTKKELLMFSLYAQ